LTRAKVLLGHGTQTCMVLMDSKVPTAIWQHFKLMLFLGKLACLHHWLTSTWK